MFRDFTLLLLLLLLLLLFLLLLLKEPRYLSIVNTERTKGPKNNFSIPCSLRRFSSTLRPPDRLRRPTSFCSVGYGVCLAGVKGSEPEVSFSPSLSATLRSIGAAQSRPIFLHDVHRDNFAFTFAFTCTITTEKILKTNLKILRKNCHDTTITEHGIISSDTSICTGVTSSC